MNANTNTLIATAQARFDEGLTYHRQGHLAQAQNMYRQVLSLQPEHFEALHLLGVIAAQMGDHARALELIARAIEINPESAMAHYNLGNAFNEMGQYQAAVESYDRAVLIKPDYVNAHVKRSGALNRLNIEQTAVGHVRDGFGVKPSDAAEEHYRRGNDLLESKQYQAAVDSYDKSIALWPNAVAALINRGLALNNLKLYEAAVASYDKAIAVWPESVEAYFNRGLTMAELKLFQAAIGSFDNALAFKPDFFDAHFQRGVALSGLKDYAAAVASYDKAIAIDADHAGTWAFRGVALRGQLGHYAEAIASFDQALALKPDYDFLYGLRLHTQTQICEWTDAQEKFAEFASKIEQGERVAPPFSVFALITSPTIQRKAAQLWVNHKLPANFELGNIQPRICGAKIRLGYFSMDFRNHAVSILTAELFETHNRDRFEVCAFSYGPDTKGEMRVRLESAFDKFIDVRDKSDKEIAELARRMEIDIAIDLAGFTSDSHAGIFAYRAAPIQINYLGYPGTMGAPYIDYLIADKTLVPRQSQQYYAEKIAYLPCFQANDSKRKISDKVFSREELGLPQSGFVFCCFNNNYKITPDTFDGWMRILKQVGESVLFLYAENDLVATNLRKEADKRGVDADRLVFGKKLPPPEYLARYRSADLFLDTLPFNAGTTASDALWAGLPVLTCTGEAFASRMAASLLSAIGLPELITHEQEDYEALAVELASNPEKMKEIKQKLERNRLSTPLFDTKFFTRHIEDAYTQMMQRHWDDLPPDHIYAGQ